MTAPSTLVGTANTQAAPAASYTLDQCRKGERVTIVSLIEQPAFAAHDADVSLRLKELGFLPGTQVQVLGFGFLGRDPVAVRVGGTKFALRRAEASKLVVQKSEGAAP